MRFTLTLLLIFTIVYPPETATAENQTAPPSSQVIAEYNEDVTGDSINEVIKLKGILFSQDSDYFMNTWVTVEAKGGKKWRIDYEGGYEPEIKFIDLTHDKVPDIFYQSATGGSGGLYYSHLHTLAGGNLFEIPLPVQKYINVVFVDNYKVKIQLSPEDQPLYMDVSDRASEYVRLGIYDKDGNLIGDSSPMIDPIAFYEPTTVSKQKGIGLKSYQQISGAYHADQLGTIETLWYYENNKWIILKSQWVEK